MATYQVRTNASGQKILSDPLTGLSSTVATSELPGAVQPDGVTTKVDSAGILSAIGGNLLLNSELWITESGTFTAPVSGWFEVLLFGGGDSGLVDANSMQAIGGTSGRIKSALIRLESGQQVSVTIGAGGVSPVINANTNFGGITSFGQVTTEEWIVERGGFSPEGMPSGISFYKSFGGGWGGGYPSKPKSNDGLTQAQRNAQCNASGHFGGGGAAVLNKDTAFYGIGTGAQGSVRVRWYDPAKAAAPVE